MKHKFLLAGLSVAATVCLALGISACGGNSGPTGTGETDPASGLRFTLSDDADSYAVTGVSDCSVKSVTIPATYKGLPVTAIGDEAFAGDKADDKNASNNCGALESVTIPASVTEIGNYAFFWCTSLTKVTFAQTSELDSIGRYAFFFCRSLTNIAIPDSVSRIGESAFENCIDLKEVDIPEEAEDIGVSAFEGCSSLVEVVIPNGVTTIYNSMFNGCTKLTTVTVPETVTTIESMAFNNCSSLADLDLPDTITYIGSSAFNGTAMYDDEEAWDGEAHDVLYIGNYLIRAKSTVEGVQESTDADGNPYHHYTVRQGIRVVAGQAFSGCTEINKITLPDSVISIGDQAFLGCNKLADIEIPDTIQSIGADVFTNTKFYTSAENWDADNILYLGNYLIAANGKPNGSMKRMTTLGDVPADYTVKEGTTVIAGEAFLGCDNMTTVTVPDSVTYLGDRAFAACGAMTDATIGEGVTSLGYQLFFQCSALTSVTVMGDLTSIESDAFRQCSNIAKLYFNGDKAAWDEVAVSESLVVISVVDETDWTTTTEQSDAFELLTVCLFSADQPDVTLGADGKDEDGYAYWHLDPETGKPALWAAPSTAN